MGVIIIGNAVLRYDDMNTCCGALDTFLVHLCFGTLFKTTRVLVFFTPLKTGGSLSLSMAKSTLGFQNFPCALCYGADERSSSGQYVCII